MKNIQGMNRKSFVKTMGRMGLTRWYWISWYSWERSSHFLRGGSASQNLLLSPDWYYTIIRIRLFILEAWVLFLYCLYCLYMQQNFFIDELFYEIYPLYVKSRIFLLSDYYTSYHFCRSCNLLDARLLWKWIQKI